MSVGYDSYLVGLQVPTLPDYGDPSSDDLSSDCWDTDDQDSAPVRTSRWRAIRSIVHFTPFIQTYKKSKYPWVQLAGHQGNFKAGRQQGTILKKFCSREKDAFELLKEDPLKPFVPQYYEVVQEEDSEFLQLEDLLGQFTNPCVMDCKLGVRTYLEEELMKAKEKHKLRKDMYEKMCQIDPNAPTPEEHRMRGVTKPRYMVWRETISTTATMGFRIEGIRKSDGTSSKDFKTVRSPDKVKEAFSSFVDGYASVIQDYLDRLYALRNALKQSQFFSTHEVIGSSLLFVHDSSRASVWMIDFAKTIPLPEGLPTLSHDKVWTPGNHEDGYHIGLSNLITIFEEIKKN
ncbi:Inositol-trisphosphate 3-kinase B [Folsomia candida]|uniref:Kinase n=1 Tax=Folsomia candida TaxID=158441 RepID=A0A226EQZ4_FOLCA|nr:Inositol-trisphosphate 3-kinase B [Folsomia candida]